MGANRTLKSTSCRQRPARASRPVRALLSALLALALLALANPDLIRNDPVPGAPPIERSPGILFFRSAMAESNLPLPRFASLQSGEVNMRRGPGETYPIMWIYQRANLPVEIIEEFENWRRIRDHDGVVGWVKASLLTGKRHALVRDQRRALRREADGDSAPVAYLDPGVVLRVLECGGDWCRLEVQGHKGWLLKTEFWGVYAAESIGD